MDFKTGWNLLSNPDTWKIPTKHEENEMKKRVDALKRSYDAVKRLNYKGSYTSFAKKIGAQLKSLILYFRGLVGKLAGIIENIRIM